MLPLAFHRFTHKSRQANMAPKLPEDALQNPSEQSITELGNPRKPEGEFGAAMLRRMNETHYAVTTWALGFWKLREGDSVLDIGCGGGLTLKRLARELTRGKLVGVDYSETSVKESRAQNREEIAAGKTEILLASVEKLPFPAGAFSKILTVESFYFWPSPAANLREVLRVLKPGGTFLLVADIYQKPGLSAHALDNIRRYELFNPTPTEFETLFREAGFPKVKIHTNPGTDWICVEGGK